MTFAALVAVAAVAVVPRAEVGLCTMPFDDWRRRVACRGVYAVTLR